MAKKPKRLTQEQERLIKENNQLMQLTEEELIKKINTKANQINRKLKTFGNESETHANIYRKNIKQSLKHLNLSERDMMTKSGNLSRSKELYKDKKKQALINQYRQYEKLLNAPQYKTKKAFNEYVEKQLDKMSRSATLSHELRINSFMDTVKRHARVVVEKDYPQLSKQEKQKMINDVVNDMVKEFGGEEGYFNNYIEWMNEQKEKSGYDSNQLMDTQIEEEMKERYLAYAKQTYTERRQRAKNPIPSKPRYSNNYQSKNSGKVGKTGKVLPKKKR